MALAQSVLDLIAQNAESEGVGSPGLNDDLFSSGVLNSFALVDLVTELEREYSIKIPDGDVSPANFQTIAAIERYVTLHKK